MFDWTGQKLGNYQIMRPLGHGGFADVYLGHHLYLKTYAAIKVLQARLANNDLQTFLQEARTVANLTHPHIVRILEFGEEGHTPYLIMDYCPNGTLRQRHPKGARVSLPECVVYAKQVAEALQYAHDHKIIHRDVKPENMLIGQNDTILLSDFGIATISQSSRYQRNQDISGTIAYSAPEQLQGKAIAASDQYSLSIVVYEWLSGELPYRGSFPEIASQHLVAPIPAIRDKVPSLPLAVEQVLKKALAKDPRQRFQNVRDFAAALELAAEGELASTVIQTELAGSQENVSTYIKDQAGTVVEPLTTLTTPIVRQTLPLSTSSFHNPPYQPNQAPPYQPMQAPPRQGRSALYIAIIAILLLALVGVSVRAFFIPPASSAQNGNTTSQTPSPGQGNSTLTPTLTPSPTATPSPTPSPTPSLPTAGTVLYNETGADSWANWTLPSDWKITPDNLIISSGGDNPPGATPGFTIPTGLVNYKIDASIRTPDTSSQWWEYGITGCGTPGNPWTGYIARIAKDYSAAVAFLTIPGKDISQQNFDPGTAWHTYELQIHGNKLSFYIDGGLVGEGTDETYITCGNQVGLYDGGGVTREIQVRSYKVTAL